MIFALLGSCAKDAPASPPATSTRPAARRVLENLDGTWRGNHQNGEVDVKFAGDRIELQVVYTTPRKGRFTIDESHSPAWLDVEWDEFGRVEMIIERVGPDKIRIQNNVQDEPRPVAFTPDEAIELTRQSE